MLDTDTASYAVKGSSEPLRQKLSAVPPSELCVSVITRAELLYGLKRLPLNHRLHQAVTTFHRLVLVLPWDAKSAAHYADIRHHLISSGQPIGELDMMIAAHSLATSVTLVTNNVRHFQRIPGLSLANWTVP
jgi:tRNA(fMet)-specific endonuclease VapC